MKVQLEQHQLDYKKLLQDARAKRTVLNDSIEAYEAACPHVIIKSGYESAKCLICEKHFGWYCPDSPDHVCHYFTNDAGKIELLGHVTPNIIDPEEGHNPKYETDDDCLFCHAPQERK